MATDLTIHRVQGITLKLTRQNDFDWVEMEIVTQDGSTSVKLFPWTNHLPLESRGDCQDTTFAGLIFDEIDDRRDLDVR